MCEAKGPNAGRDYISKNVASLQLFCRPLRISTGECRREYMVKRVRLPFQVRLQRWIGKLSSMIVASLDTCGECRRNYMALWAPVRLRAAAKSRGGLTAGQR